MVQITASSIALSTHNHPREKKADCSFELRLHIPEPRLPLSLEIAIPSRTESHQQPPQMFPACRFPPVLSHCLVELTEIATHNVDCLTCYCVSNGPNVGNDTTTTVSPLRLERGTPVPQRRAFARQALSQPLNACNIYEQKTKAVNGLEPLVCPYLLQCCYKRVPSNSTLKSIGRQCYHKSICWLQLKVHTQQFMKNEQQWSWNPGGNLSSWLVDADFH